MSEDGFYPALGYACREREGVGFMVGCHSAIVEAESEFLAKNRMLSFILEQFPHESGWTGHAVSLADMAGYEIGRDPSVGELDPGYKVFFACAAREYYRSPLAGWRAPEVAVVSMVIHCQNSLAEGHTGILEHILEKFPKEGRGKWWRGHLPILIDTTGFKIARVGTGKDKTVTKIESQALEIERLKRREVELVAQLASTYSIAIAEIKKASVSHCTGSGILLRIAALGGKEIIAPVVIRDGLSAETINCLIADIERSRALAISY